MSNSPGLRNQEFLRVEFRVAGVVLLVAAGACLFVALRDFFTLEGFEQPTHFWLMFVGLLMTRGLRVVPPGRLPGASARYTAGETMPVVRAAAAYLTDGEGVLGNGRTLDDAPDACGNALA